MIGPDRLSRVSAESVVPEQVIAYVRAVAGSRPRMLGACIGYEYETTLVLVGYPLHAPQDAGAMAEAVEQALKTPGLHRLTVIGPARPPQAPAGIQALEDVYLALPVPPPPPAQKLRNILRRARRDLRLDRGRHLGDDHLALVQRYLDNRHLDSGTRHIFRQLPRFIETSDGSLIASARFADGRLAAFAVGEFASFSTGFFMFCFRDPSLAPPGAADLTLSGLLEEAHQRGQTRMNLGLGVNAGIRFFKRKWGAEAFLRYVEISWEPASHSVFWRQQGILRRGKR
jgi:Acetyltransferase (GNAT) domain